MYIGGHHLNNTTSCRKLGINCSLKNLAWKENFFYSGRVEATLFNTHRRSTASSGLWKSRRWRYMVFVGGQPRS